MSGPGAGRVAARVWKVPEGLTFELGLDERAGWGCAEVRVHYGHRLLSRVPQVWPSPLTVKGSAPTSCGGGPPPERAVLDASWVSYSLARF